MSFAVQTIAVAMRDLRIELRARHALGVVLPFAGTLLIAFGLSLGPGRRLLEETAPGLLWLAILFASVLAFRGSYEAETEDAGLEALLLSPADRGALFLGKAGAIVVQLLALEIVVVLLVVVLFDITLGGNVLTLAAAFLLGTIGLAAVGNIFAVLTASARAREAVFPLLTLPVAIPILIAGVKAVALTEVARSGEAASWLGLLLVFDLVYVSVGMLLFGSLLED
jgi:heme exporter protein B